MPNLLKNQKSKYLLQHQDNPVEWHYSFEEAKKLAHQQNRPIFLSIGYSSCHWCHVMNHESFSDLETATLLNQNFVCLKVDREELPDLDLYYQQACQLFTGGGGWPLSAFLLPDGRPYYAGTYFPLTAQKNIPSFKNILQEISRVFKEEKGKIEENAQKVHDQIVRGQVSEEKIDYPGHFPNPSSIYQAIKEYIDPENGGFGKSPKFPHFPFLEWSVEQVLEGMIPREEAAPLLEGIERMLMGGIFDHARGGIHRYSTDNKWLVPHFEKMLYDQAGLLKLLSKYVLVKPSIYAFDAILETLLYLESEMQSEEGFFFSAQDADSEGVEGLFYTFTQDEFLDTLTKSQFNKEEELTKELEKIKSWFNLEIKGHLEGGLNVIALNHKHKSEFQNESNWNLIRRVRRSLLEERRQRIPPMTDNKGVASWNFMILSALIEVKHYCPIKMIKDKAAQILEHNQEKIFARFLRNGAITHSTTLEDGTKYFEDYVFAAEAALRLYEHSQKLQNKETIKQLIETGLHSFLFNEKFYVKAQGPEVGNLPASIFDTSFKSPLSTFVLTIRRASLLFPECQWEKKLEGLIEELKNKALRNPISSGEAIRAFIYPEEIFRVIKVPKSYQQEEKFTQLLPYFLSRFVISYEDVNEWQICTKNKCEVQGKDLNDFIENITKQKA
jgi:uncharacterized protein